MNEGNSLSNNSSNLCTSASSGAPARYVPPHLRNSNNIEETEKDSYSTEYRDNRNNREYRGGGDRDYRNDNRG